MTAQISRGEWVLLTYRLPREPSTPRIAVWRRLRSLGVAQLADGLVGLPADARTREHLEWVAAEVMEAGGDATVWLAKPASVEQDTRVSQTLRSAREEEYRRVREQAEASATGTEEVGRVVKRLRAELRRIRRRDYFPTDERDLAVAAVEQLATAGDAAATPRDEAAHR